MALFDDVTFAPQTYGGIPAWLGDILRMAQATPAPSQGFPQPEAVPMPQPRPDSQEMSARQQQPQPSFGMPTFNPLENTNSSPAAMPIYPIEGGQGAPAQLARLNSLPGKSQDSQPQPQPQQQGMPQQQFMGPGGSLQTTLYQIAGALNPNLRHLGEQNRAQQIQNHTQQALVSRGIDPATARVIAGNPALLTQVLSDQLGFKDRTEDIKEYEYAKKRDGFQGTFADWMARKGRNLNKFGLNPIYGTGPDGKPVILQLGESGEMRQTTLPNGVQLSTGIEKHDAGTYYIITDKRSGQYLGTMPKNVAEEAAAKKFGAGQGEAQDALASMNSKMPGLEKVVSKLDELSNKATYTIAGQVYDYTKRQLGGEPRESAIARAEYISMVDNQILPLLRDTFGAQFTQKEGETLRQTLGDPDKSPREKQAVLKAFIEQKRRDIEALQSRVGGQQQPATSVPQIPQGLPAPPPGFRVQ